MAFRLGAPRENLHRKEGGVNPMATKRRWRSNKVAVYLSKLSFDVAWKQVNRENAEAAEHKRRGDLALPAKRT